MLAGAAALVAGELAGRLVDGAAGPVVAVGNRVVDLAPPALRDAGIGLLGTLDKPVLLVGVLVVCAALAASAGRLFVRHPVPALLLVDALALVAALAVRAEPGATTLGAVAVALAIAGAGAGCLALLLARRRVRRPVPGQTRPAAVLDRRHFLRRTAVVVVATAAGGGLLQLLDVRGRVAVARAALRLRPPVRTAPGDLAAAELGLPGLTPLHTPTRSFYRIDTALVVPQVDPDDWTLTVGGMVDRPLVFTLDQLLELPQVEADITISCVSNEVGGDLVGLARWQGVRLRDVLAMAGVQPGAEQVVGVSVDDFTAGFPLRYATDDRFALIALGMNGELLPVEHGFPARLIVPGLYGYVSATKWLRSIELTTWRGFDGYWIPRGWSKEGPIKTSSRIDVPADTSSVPAGPVTVAGMAWAPGRRRGITAVEVRVDRAGPWLPAELGPAVSEDAWRQWHLSWQATPGEHLLEVRATDRTGDVQTERRADPRPNGASGLHAVRVLVT